MGKALSETPAAAAVFARADAILGYSLSELCFNGPREQLDATEHSQPALLVCSVAALAVLAEPHRDVPFGTADFCAGLSLGEYTALVHAGAIDFEDALRVVRERGLAMQEASDREPGGMVSILGLEDDRVAELCDAARQKGEVLQVANLLCPGNVAISGHRASCARAVELSGAFGAMRAVPLAVAGAFHTPLMQGAAERLAAALEQSEIRPPAIPVISNVDAEVHNDPAAIRENLVRQVASPVLWSRSMVRLVESGIREYCEIGHGRVLRGLMKRIDRTATCHGFPE
jgi:[acyl-carrier-protein] S-malonyltransferase